MLRAQIRAAEEEKHKASHLFEAADGCIPPRVETGLTLDACSWYVLVHGGDCYICDYMCICIYIYWFGCGLSGAGKCPTLGGFKYLFQWDCLNITGIWSNPTKTHALSPFSQYNCNFGVFRKQHRFETTPGQPPHCRRQP